MTFYNAARLSLTNMLHPEPGDAEETKSRHLLFRLQRFLQRHLQSLTEPLPKVGRAVRLIRNVADPAWAAVALLVTVLLGGFAWLSSELHRIETKVDAVSLRLAEMPRTVQGELQAQTERLTALISFQRQSEMAGRPTGTVASTRGGAPAPSHVRKTNGSHAGSGLAGSAAPGSSGASPHSGATADAGSKVANSTAFAGNPRRP